MFVLLIHVDNDDLSILTCFNNVVVTYHQAWFTEESMQGICYTTLTSFHAVRLDQSPPAQRKQFKTLVSQSF
eukprot:Skav221580  [mRNA]  locus=scaffold630:99020:101950:- [translate_table: standard]